MYNDQHDDTLHSGEDEHVHIRRSFPVYALAVVLDQNPEERYPQVMAHLNWCGICRAELEQLIANTLPAYSGSLFAAPYRPMVDLSFLQQVPMNQPWWVTQEGRLVVAYSADLLEQTRQSDMMVSRGRSRYAYQIDDAYAGTLRLSIDITVDDLSPFVATMEVTVDMTSRDPLDQGGAVVMLQAGGHFWEGVTSASGIVAFGDIPSDSLGVMRIEVQPPRF